MLLVAQRVFDDVVSGAGTNWYSPAQLNELLGAAESLVIQVSVTGLSGTSPTLTVQFEHSGDNQFWVAYAGNPQINAVSISNDTTYMGITGYVVALHFVRVRISLGGTTPQARLKAYVTGYDLGHRSTGQGFAAGMPSGLGASGGPVPAL